MCYNVKGTVKHSYSIITGECNKADDTEKPVNLKKLRYIR